MAITNFTNLGGDSYFMFTDGRALPASSTRTCLAYVQAHPDPRSHKLPARPDHHLPVPLTGPRAIHQEAGRSARPPSFSASLVAWLAGSATGLARAGRRGRADAGQVIVPADHVLPGETLPVTGHDLDEAAPVRIELVAGDARAELGTAIDGRRRNARRRRSCCRRRSRRATRRSCVHATGHDLVDHRPRRAIARKGPEVPRAAAPVDWVSLGLVLAGTAIFAIAAVLVRAISAVRRGLHDGPADPE